MILKEGKAKFGIFWESIHDVNMMKDLEVKVHDSGIVEVKTEFEDFLTHITNCTIIWDAKDEEDIENPTNKVRLLRPAKLEQE
jgi:hypothetical protein